MTHISWFVERIVLVKTRRIPTAARHNARRAPLQRELRAVAIATAKAAMPRLKENRDLRKDHVAAVLQEGPAISPHRLLCCAIGLLGREPSTAEASDLYYTVIRQLDELANNSELRNYARRFLHENDRYVVTAENARKRATYLRRSRDAFQARKVALGGAHYLGADLDYVALMLSSHKTRTFVILRHVASLPDIWWVDVVRGINLVEEVGGLLLERQCTMAHLEKRVIEAPPSSLRAASFDAGMQHYTNIFHRVAAPRSTPVSDSDEDDTATSVYGPVGSEGVDGFGDARVISEEQLAAENAVDDPDLLEAIENSLLEQGPPNVAADDDPAFRAAVEQSLLDMGPNSSSKETVAPSCASPTATRVPSTPHGRRRATRGPETQVRAHNFAEQARRRRFDEGMAQQRQARLAATVPALPQPSVPATTDDSFDFFASNSADADVHAAIDDLEFDFFSDDEEPAAFVCFFQTTAWDARLCAAVDAVEAADDKRRQAALARPTARSPPPVAAATVAKPTQGRRFVRVVAVVTRRLSTSPRPTSPVMIRRIDPKFDREFNSGMCVVSEELLVRHGVPLSRVPRRPA